MILNMWAEQYIWCGWDRLGRTVSYSPRRRSLYMMCDCDFLNQICLEKLPLNLAYWHIQYWYSIEGARTIDPVREEILKLKVNKASGPDDISPKVIRVCSNVLMQPLSILYNSCISSSTFPDDFKRAKVIPLHKQLEKVLWIIIDQ